MRIERTKSAIKRTVVRRPLLLGRRAGRSPPSSSAATSVSASLVGVDRDGVLGLRIWLRAGRVDRRSAGRRLLASRFAPSREASTLPTRPPPLVTCCGRPGARLAARARHVGSNSSGAALVDLGPHSLIAAEMICDRSWATSPLRCGTASREPRRRRHDSPIARAIVPAEPEERVVEIPPGGRRSGRPPARGAATSRGRRARSPAVAGWVVSAAEIRTAIERCRRRPSRRAGHDRPPRAFGGHRPSRRGRIAPRPCPGRRLWPRRGGR